MSPTRGEINKGGKEVKPNSEHETVNPKKPFLGFQYSVSKLPQFSVTL